MFSQDWVDHMKEVMEHGQVGDRYDVIRIWLALDGSGWRHDYGSSYMKTTYGHTSALYTNRHLLKETM